MKNIAFLFILFAVNSAFSQEVKDSTFVFSGFVFDLDSIPIEGVYLMNCRTLKAVSSDSLGRFRTRVAIGDSLVIHHISYTRMFVHPNAKPAHENEFLLSFRPYELSSVRINDYKISDANFKKNMGIMMMHIRGLDKPVDYKLGGSPQTVNPYAPGATAPGFGINLLDLFRKKKKR